MTTPTTAPPPTPEMLPGIRLCPCDIKNPHDTSGYAAPGFTEPSIFTGHVNNANRVKVKLWPAVLFITATLTFLALMGAWTVAGASKAKVTWISGQPLHYAAVTRQPGRLDFERGAVIRLEKGRRHLIVRQMDFCSGSGCQDLDLSHAGFDYLGSPSRGVMSLNWGCGRTGNLPKQRCLR